MRSAAKLCMVFAVILLVISTCFQGLALAAVTVIEDHPGELFTENGWLIPIWIVALVLLPVAAVLCGVLKEKGHWLWIPLVVGLVGTVLALIVALTLKEGLPARINELGEEQGLTTWKLIYRHLSSVFAGVLVVASAALHMGGCREDRIRRENEEYKSVYHLEGGPLFKDEAASTLGLDTFADEQPGPTRKLKRSLRHKQNKT